MRLPGDIDLDMALAVWMRNATVYRHTWHMNVLPNFFEPVLVLVGLGVGLGGYLEGGMGGRDYAAYVGPGLLATAAMNGGAFEATYNVFVKMNFARLYDAFLGTPAEVQDLVFGELLWAVTRSIIYGIGFAAVLLLFTLLGGAPILTSPFAVLLPVAVALTGAVFALIGLLFTGLIRVIDLYSYFFTLFLTPLYFFSGIFYPVERFPLGAALAWWTPLYHSARLCRGLAQGPLGTEHLVSTLWLLVAIAVLLAIVPGRYRARLVQ